MGKIDKREPRPILWGIIKEMKAHFLEMDEIIEGLTIALVAEQNILLIGPPGSAKTQISKFIAKAIGGEFFDQLMTKHTVPDELFGPVDIIAMREKKVFKRVTEGTLATADIALLDEIWKASSAIVNYLLRALNEREFKENGKVVKLPLKMAIGCSNEYPTGEETSAIFDRFNLKYEATYITEDGNFLSLLGSKDEDPAPSSSLTMEELQAMIDEAKKIPVPKSIMEVMIQMRRELLRNGIILSPRRWKKAVRFLKARAYLRKADHVEEDDLGFLSNVLWNQPEQRIAVVKLIAQVINPLIQKAMEFMDMANEIWTNLKTTSGSSRSKALVEARAKFANMRKELAVLETQMLDQKRSTTKLKEIMDSVSAYQRKVAEELLTGTT